MDQIVLTTSPIWMPVIPTRKNVSVKRYPERIMGHQVGTVAAVKSKENFYKCVYGIKFLLRSDHAMIKWLMKFKNHEE